MKQRARPQLSTGLSIQVKNKMLLGNGGFGEWRDTRVRSRTYPEIRVKRNPHLTPKLGVSLIHELVRGVLGVSAIHGSNPDLKNA